MSRFWIGLFLGLFLLLSCSALMSQEGGIDGYPKIADFKHRQEIAKKAMQRYIPLDKAQNSYIGYVAIKDKKGINRSTWIHVKKALEYFKEKKPLFILLHIDTPGGELLACEQISRELKHINRNEGIPVVAYIEHWALSGGALTAYSCPFIFASEDATMGAATPVTKSSHGEIQKASEKIVSALRADFASTAHFYGKSAILAQAMVDDAMLVVMRDGHIIALNQNEEAISSGKNPDYVISPRGKLLTMTASEMLAFGVVESVVPFSGKHPSEKKENKNSWPFGEEPIAQVPYFSQMKEATVHEYVMDWKVGFLVLLANPLVASLLLFGVIIGGYLEWQTPGFGVAGGIAILCLCLTIISSLSIDALNWLELALVLVGIILLVLEFFVIPGFGVIGIAGFIALVFGIILLFLPSLRDVSFDWFSGETNAAGEFLLERLIWLLGTIIFSILVLLSFSRWLNITPGVSNRLVSTGEQERDLGYESAGGQLDSSLIGQEAVTYTVLRPSGKIRLGGKLYAAQSNGTFIDIDEKVEVIAMRGKTLLVSKIST